MCVRRCASGEFVCREGEYFQYDMCIGCGNCAIACPYESIARIETGKFNRAQAKKAAAVGRPFYRPYPVASHAAAPGFWEWISASHAKGQREPLAGSEFAQIRDRNDRVREATPGQEAAEGPVPVEFPSSATSVTGCPSWDVCTIARPARPCTFLQRLCSDKRRRSEGARPCSAKHLGKFGLRRRPKSEHPRERFESEPASHPNQRQSDRV